MSAPTGRRRAAIRSVLFVGCLLVVPTVPIPSMLRAATPPAGDGEPVQVSLLDVSPLAPTAADVLTVSGTVVNRGSETLTNLNTYLRLSRVATTEAADLARLTAPDFRGGFRPGPFTPLDAALRPGQSLPFQLEVPVPELGFTSAGVYPIGVEILATFEDGSRGVAGRSTTVVPWLPVDVGDTAGGPAIDVALVVPLTAAVDRGADGAYLSEHLGELLTPTGALGALLARADGAPAGSDDDVAGGSLGGAVTWLLDPAVLEAAADLADGYDVRGGDAGDPPTPGTYAAEASAWLEQLSTYARTGSVRLLSYANVDAVALVRAGLAADVVAALRAAPDTAAAALDVPAEQLLGGADSMQLLYPPDGLVDDATLHVLAGAGVRSLLLSETGVDAGQRHGASTVETDGVEVTTVGVDSTLSGLLSAPQGALTARQLVLAHTALAALDQRGSSNPSPLVVVPPAALPAAAIPALEVLAGAAPWVRLVPVQEGEEGGGATTALRYPDTAAGNELAADYVRQLAQLGATLETYSSLSGDLVSASDLGRARIRAASAGWRSDPRRAAALVAGQAATLDAALGQVRIVTTGTVTLSSDSGRFPLTVANDLDRPVTVRLALSSRTPARLQTSTPELIEIAAGTKRTVDVSAKATANGVYVVDARLQTAAGATFGPPVAVTLRATQYDTVAWIVMAAAGGLIFVGSGLRLARRARASRRIAS